MLLLDPIDTLHRRRQGGQLVLRLIPLSLIDQLLHLCEFGLRGQYHRVVTGGALVAEEHAAHTVEPVARSGGEDRGAEAPEAENGRGRRTDDCQ